MSKFYYTLIMINMAFFSCGEVNTKEKEVKLPQFQVEEVDLKKLKNESTELKIYEGKSISSGFSKWSLLYEQETEIRNILNNNLFQFFNIESQYRTDLQKKLYKESIEYKQRSEELQNLKNDLTSAQYYIDWRLDEYKSNRLTYNLDAQTFSQSLYANGFFSKQDDFIQFDKVIMKVPLGVTKSSELIRYRDQRDITGMSMIKSTTLQKFDFKVLDEIQAEKIERNSSNIRILFLFKFNPIQESQDYFNTDLNKIFIYNFKNDEVYYIF